MDSPVLCCVSVHRLSSSSVLPVENKELSNSTRKLAAL